VISLQELADLLVQLNGSGDFVNRAFPADRKAIDVGDYYADFNLIRTTLKWEPQTPLKDGLLKTLAYYKENLEHYI
jgi:UDP-glucose 4-epimerase